MSKIHDIKNYKISSTDTFFFDNNIWMYLFAPIANSKKSEQKDYSDFFNSVCTARATIWINSMVLSEFCNSWLRIEYNNWKKEIANVQRFDYKKDFIPSNIYQETIAEIKQTLPNILKKTERCTDNFNSINIDNVLKELNNCDFNDSYYIELAKSNNWKIVTHDADFFKNNSSNVEIITANIK